MLRAIAVFKFSKTALMIVLGVGALRLVHMDINSVLEHWVLRLGLNPGGRYVGVALEKAANLTPDKVAALGIGSLVYAALFLTEGIGLWLLKRWAMWFTVILTGSFLPVEIYELARHLSAGKAALLAINLALVVYLIRRIRDERSG